MSIENSAFLPCVVDRIVSQWSSSVSFLELNQSESVMWIAILFGLLPSNTKFVGMNSDRFLIHKPFRSYDSRKRAGLDVVHGRKTSSGHGYVTGLSVQVGGYAGEPTEEFCTKWCWICSTCVPLDTCLLFVSIESVEKELGQFKVTSEKW